MNQTRHECVCPRKAESCLPHHAQEWGGGEADICAPHGHDATGLRDALARALTGVVFRDTASNERIADVILARLRHDPDAVAAFREGIE